MNDPDRTDDRPYRYTAALAEEIELRWQDEWDRRGTYRTPNPVGPLTDAEGRTADPAAPPFFIMDMFPYPSAATLHVGHPLGYIATDVVGRYQRMRGANVLHALGFDAFGLPAEQYAVQTGQHPRVTTEANIAIMKGQLRRLGLAHDPRRTFATIDADFVRWTQWIFLQIFDSWYDDLAPRPDGGTGRARPVAELVAEYAAGTRSLPTDVDGVGPDAVWATLDEPTRRRVIDSQRLAYLSDTPVNWAPGLGTVLANEEVTADGRSERGNFPVFRRRLRQWNLRITAFADRLADDLDRIDWPEKVKSMQRHWIGRSRGARIRFPIIGTDDSVEVFTTRPDTVFGATFLVLAPEHPLLAGATDEVAAYQREAAAKTALERQQDAGRKTGVLTELHAVNPVNGEKLPVYTADYVLMGYGTGAIMAVPGGDERDREFAEAYGLPVVEVITTDGDEPTLINSSHGELSLDGLTVPAATETIIGWLIGNDAGEATTTYRLQDWLFSRQRYWGEPFPIVYDEHDTPVALPASALPVELPDVPDFSPRTFDPDDADSEPEPPLGRNTDWLNVELDLGDGPKSYRRDANTMPNWAGSCWYYLRYLDPTSDEVIIDPALERYWMGPGHGEQPAGSTGGVDLYVGGVEHAVLHLLYARFWHKVLHDLGHVSSVEPFHRLFNQGYIQAYAYTDQRGFYVPAEEVEPDEASPTGFCWQGQPVRQEYGKIGKSLKNSVSPDEMYAAYGADTLRVYEMSMGPLDLSRPWETRAVVGAQRFLQRLWRNVVDETTGTTTVTDGEPDEPTLRLLHQTVAGVRDDMAAMRFNTAIAKLIVFNNHLVGLESVPRQAIEPLVAMTAPIAPHLAEELWHRLGHRDSVVHERYPEVDPRYLVVDTVTCVLQVSGKLRGRVEVATDIDEPALEALALADPGVQRALDGREVRRVIIRAPKLVNVVPA